MNIQQPLYSRCMGRILCVGILASLVISACQPRTPAQDLAFVSIDHEPYPPGDFPKWYDHPEPGIAVLITSNDVAVLEKMVGPAAMQAIENADFQKDWFICIFQGRKQTLGYSVKVTKITIAGDEIRVYATFTNPPYGKPVGQIETSPYLLVKLDREVLPTSGQATFLLIANERIVANLFRLN